MMHKIQEQETVVDTNCKAALSATTRISNESAVNGKTCILRPIWNSIERIKIPSRRETLLPISREVWVKVITHKQLKEM